jgi:RNA polymerase sigma factor (sigma-70 family)
MVGSVTAAEDVVQDTFIRAYMAYDGYQERGLLRQWLRTIAYNAALRYLQQATLYQPGGLYPDDGMAEKLVDTVTSVEDQVVANELTEQIIQAIASLPEAQRSTVYYRFVRDYSVSEVADLTHQPVGSVKSKSHYGLRKVRKMLSDYITTEVETVMDCRAAYVFLYQYAKGQIMPADKERVAGHLAVCDNCREITSALEKLAPCITPACDREMRHYLISIPLAEDLILSYFGMTFPVDGHERLNERLRKNNGMIPSEEMWFGAGHDANFDHIGEFDNEGHPIEFELVPNPDAPNNVRVKYRKMVKVYPEHTMASVGLRRDTSVVTASIEDPHLRYGRLKNSLGSNAKSGLYLAIPNHAQNIRIKRGNGVIDAGLYKFTFADRYVAGDEQLRLECSWLMYES